MEAPSKTAVSETTNSEAPKKEKAGLALSPWQKTLAGTTAAALVITVAISSWLYGVLISDVEASRLAVLTREQAQQQSIAVQLYLEELQKDLLRFTQRPALATAIKNQNQAVQDSFLKGLKKTFGNVEAIRFIPKGSAKLEQDNAIPIRFSELDMIHRAEKRLPVFAEAARINDRWLLNLVSPLPHAKESGADTNVDGEEDITPVTGTILLTLNTDKLSALLQKADSSLGQTQLLQLFKKGAKPQLLQQTGSAVPSAPVVTLDVASSHWQISFAPSQQLILQAAESPLVLILIILVISGFAVVAAFLAAKAIIQKQETSAAKVRHHRAVSDAASAVPAGEKNIANPIYHDQDILDIDVIDEDQDILGLTDAPAQSPQATAQGAGLAADNSANQAMASDANDVVFRAYDIRGIVGEQLTYSLAEKIGQALGSEVLDHGDNSIIVARDARTHSPEMTQKLVDGLLSTGCNVINIGIVPTPLMNFATHELEGTSSGVMVTASHNPAEYNGFKMVVKGKTLADEAIEAIRSRIMRGQFHQGQGSEDHQNVIPEYIDRIFSDVALAGEVSIVVDAGNGVTGEVAPLMLEELGCDVIPLYCELDGNFPNHEPDPTIEANLQDLIAKVKETEADLGVAFDGDGDRLTIVTPKGEIIWPDRLLMLFAKDIVARNPGADVLFDVKCTRQLNGLISGYGGRPIMWKTGHSHMKGKMVETGALLGGELSGHIFIKDRWYGFDDGMYATARLLEIMTLRDQDLDTIFEGFPVLPATPEIKVAVSEQQKFAIIKELVANGDFQNGKITTIDGLRVDFAKGWGLVRASNTSPALTLRFEGETDEAVEQLKDLFKRELKKVDENLPLTF